MADTGEARLRVVQGGSGNSPQNGRPSSLTPVVEDATDGLYDTSIIHKVRDARACVCVCPTLCTSLDEGCVACRGVRHLVCVVSWLSVEKAAATELSRSIFADFLQ